MSEENRENEYQKEEVKQEENTRQASYSFWAEQVAKNQSEQHNHIDVSAAPEEVFDGNANQMNQSMVEGNNPYQSVESSTENMGNGANFATMDSSYRSMKNNYYQPNYSNMTEDNSYFQEQEMNEQLQEPRRHRKRNHKFAKFVVNVVASGVVAAGCFIGVLYGYQRFFGNGYKFGSLINTQDIPYLQATTVLDEPAQFETNASMVYKEVLPSIVAIDSTISQSINIFGQTYENQDVGSGSGIIVGETETELLIATNNHVVDGATKINITFIDGSTAEAITKGTDAAADLAVVSIDVTTLTKDTLTAIKVATLGNSDQLLEGEPAIAIGNALGYGQSITIGCISAINRTVQLEDGEKVLLQTDAAINPGNSGGALINSKGEVIGINTVKLVTSSVEGMGYAIPISYANPILEELMSREIIKVEDQGYLGVRISEVTESVAESFDIPLGVIIREVTEGSAAQKAGLLNNDIVTGIEGVEVTTASSLQEKVKSYRYGTKITVTVQRLVDGNYKEMNFEVVLGRNPAYESKPQE